MVDAVEIPMLTLDDIRTRADEFLAECDALYDRPVDVEAIVEHHMQIEIIPADVKFLTGCSGFLNSKCTAIYLDNSMFGRFGTPAREAVVHELGHLVLHAAGTTAIQSEAEFETFHSRIDRESLERAERDVEAFGDFFLVPSATLSDSVTFEYEAAVRLISDKAVEVDFEGRPFWMIIATAIASQYEVGWRRAVRRMMQDGLWMTRPGSNGFAPLEVRIESPPPFERHRNT